MSAETHAGTRRKVPRDEAARDQATRDEAARDEAGCPAAGVRVDADGVWRVEGYAPARTVLRSTQTRQGGFGVEDADRMPRKMRRPVLWRDGAEHREHRRQTARYFTPRRVDEAYRDLMHRFAEEQCDRLRRQRRADVSDLSFSLAVAVAAEVVGLTPQRPGMARRLERFFTERPAPPGSLRRQLRNNLSLLAFYVRDVRPAVRARRRQRRDDLISHLLDEGCTSGEVLIECSTFAAAGMITTREFITLAAWHFFTDDALRAAYVTGDESARLAILREILRLEPVVANLTRLTTDAVELPGADGPVTVPAGARVDIAVAVANLDPSAVGPEPAELRPDRPLGRGVADAGLAFGEGPHKCPGAHVAIVESDIFLSKLFALPNLRMARPPKVRIREAISSYELVGMIVTLD